MGWRSVFISISKLPRWGRCRDQSYNYAPGVPVLAKAAKRCSARVRGSLLAADAVTALPEPRPPPTAGGPDELAGRATPPSIRTPRGTPDGRGKAATLAAGSTGARSAEQQKSCETDGSRIRPGKHSRTWPREGCESPTSGVASSCRCRLRKSDKRICLAPNPSSWKACFHPPTSPMTCSSAS